MAATAMAAPHYLNINRDAGGQLNAANCRHREDCSHPRGVWGPPLQRGQRKWTPYRAAHVPGMGCAAQGALLAAWKAAKHASGSVAARAALRRFLTFVHALLSMQEKGKKKLQKSAAGSICLAAGTAAGDVKLYDVHLGELKWRAVDVVQG